MRTPPFSSAKGRIAGDGCFLQHKADLRLISFPRESILWLVPTFSTLPDGTATVAADKCRVTMYLSATVHYYFSWRGRKNKMVWFERQGLTMHSECFKQQNTERGPNAFPRNIQQTKARRRRALPGSFSTCDSGTRGRPNEREESEIDARATAEMSLGCGRFCNRRFRRWLACKSLVAMEMSSECVSAQSLSVLQIW